MIFSYEIMRQQYYLKQMQINSHENFLQLSSGIVIFCTYCHSNMLVSNNGSLNIIYTYISKSFLCVHVCVC